MNFGLHADLEMRVSLAAHVWAPQSDWLVKFNQNSILQNGFCNENSKISKDILYSNSNICSYPDPRKKYQQDTPQFEEGQDNAQTINLNYLNDNDCALQNKNIPTS